MKTTNTFLTSALLALLAMSSITGCSSSTDTPTTASVSFTSETEGSHVSSAFWKKNAVTPTSGIAADSIEITRVRFLLSAVKLHVEGNDTTKDGTIKTGPFILEFTPGLSRVFSTITIPAGTYEKIKFEIHKFPSSIDQSYINDPTFADFTKSDRTTVVIEGRVWSGNSSIPTNFVYQSHITANLEAKFPGTITLDGGSTNTLAMVFSPMLAFKSSYVLDPRDPASSNDIDNYLKSAIKSLKK